MNRRSTNSPIFFVISIFLSFMVYGQINYDDGYVIDINDFTLKGKIMASNPNLYSTQITFINARTNEKRVYKPSDIKSWHVDANNISYFSKTYRLSPIKAYQVFMRRKCNGKGKVKVYEYWNTDGNMGYVQTFLEKDDELTEISFGSFKKFMATYFEDYPALVEKINAKKFKKREFMKIVQEYNDWRESLWR